MKESINIDTWPRRQHYNLFKKYKDPFYGLVVNIDCTRAMERANDLGHSFFLTYLYNSIRAVNHTKALKLRIENELLYAYERIDVSAVIERPYDGFGFSLIQYDPDFERFLELANIEIDRVKKSKELFPPTNPNNVIHYSSLPWLQFSSLSHAQSLDGTDSVPKISFGKVFEQDNRKMIPYSIHVHHALVDGKDIAIHVDHFQKLMTSL